LLVDIRGALVWIDEATRRPVRVPDWARAAIGVN
jgi:acyl-CoA thioesterase FadM